MFDQLADLDPTAVLNRAVDRRRTADAAEAELLAIAAHWADLHAVLPGQDPAGFRVPGMEKLAPLAGPGTPAVAEFAPAELGAALGISTYAATQLVGDGLELRHRLPKVWARIQDESLPAWRGRKIAQATRCLPQEAAAWVDAQVAGFAHKIGLGRLTALIEAAMIRYDPEQAARRAKQAADQRDVWISDQMTDGTRSIAIQADALDATAFDDTLTQIADALGRLGDEDVKAVRRATAVGVIADPQGALDLLTEADDADDPTGEQQSAAQPTRAGHGAGRPKVVLYLHLHESAIHTSTGVGRVEGLGPVSEETVREWAGRSDLTINRVIDLADRTSVDAYEIPERMQDTVLLRNPCCPYPWCNNISRNKDMDHIREYVPPDEGGPPAQTAAHKLGPLCRRHHRLKTHGGWTYTMAEPGIYLWRSPRGRRYLVDHTGATALPHTA